jgi:large subunit ribosomal protein L10
VWRESDNGDVTGSGCPALIHRVDLTPNDGRPTPRRGVSHIPTAEKEQAIQELTDLVSRSKGAILTDYRGFTVAEITELRKRLREQGAVYHVVKNTLFKRALQDGEGLVPYLEGPTAIAFALQDPVAPAKAILDFIREKRKGVVKAGFIEGVVYTEPQVGELSKLPSRDMLIAQVVGGIQSPITGLVGSLNGILSNFVYTLQAIVDKQGGAAEG